MKPLTIGQVARHAGVGIETVRFYERQGLLEEPARRESGYRQYPEDVVARLRFIKRAKEVGFSLKEIRQLLALQVESTKKSPGTFSGTRFLGFAMTEPPYPSFYPGGSSGPEAVVPDDLTPAPPSPAPPTSGLVRWRQGSLTPG